MRKALFTLSTAGFLLLLVSYSGADKEKFPAPRFPSYIQAPESIDDVLPYARAAVRQTGGRTPLGLVEKGMTVAIFTEPTAEEMVIEAIKRAFEERGVKVQIVPQHELVGVSKEQAMEALSATRWYTSEQGYMEAQRWITRRFADRGAVPKAWLLERRPDLFEAVFAKELQVPDKLQSVARKFRRSSLARAIIKYLDEHKEVDAIFWRRGGRTATRKALNQYSDKFYGNFIFDNRWELMNKAATFPGDVWKLVEERVIEPLAWIDQAHVTDPEGTDFTFELDEKQAAAWAKGAYQQGHLYMFPHQATGRFPYSTVEYPSFGKAYNPRFLVEVNGVFAGTNNHTGAFPRIEVHVKNGYVKEVKGGGIYGELWREFLQYPNINELTYPYHDKPGYWWIYEAGMGTNPKFFKRPDENLSGTNRSERNKAGVIHWGFGLRLQHGPDGPFLDPKWQKFAESNNLPDDHWWHIHNLMPTYRVRVRGTKSTWLTLINKGRVTALDGPEIRALASRYGEPKKVLSDDWSPHLPGINAPGKYADYAKDPWKTMSSVIKKIEAGTYEYFYPKIRVKK